MGGYGEKTKHQSTNAKRILIVSICACMLDGCRMLVSSWTPLDACLFECWKICMEMCCHGGSALYVAVVIQLVVLSCCVRHRRVKKSNTESAVSPFTAQYVVSSSVPRLGGWGECALKLLLLPVVVSWQAKSKS